MKSFPLIKLRSDPRRPRQYPSPASPSHPGIRPACAAREKKAPAGGHSRATIVRGKRPSARSVRGPGARDRVLMYPEGARKRWFMKRLRPGSLLARHLQEERSQLWRRCRSKPASRWGFGDKSRLVKCKGGGGQPARSPPGSRAFRCASVRAPLVTRASAEKAENANSAGSRRRGKRRPLHQRLTARPGAPRASQSVDSGSRSAGAGRRSLPRERLVSLHEVW